MTDELEDKVRAMLQRRAGDVDPSPGAWDEIERKVDHQRRRSVAAGRRWMAVAAAVAVVAGVAVAVVATRPEDESVIAGPGETTTTTPTPAGAVDPAYDVPAVWPATTAEGLGAARAEQRAGRRQALGSPEDAALEYLAHRWGGADGVTVTFQAGDTRSGEVSFEVPTTDEHRAFGGTVLVRQTGDDPSMWVVMGAMSETLDIHQLAYDGKTVTGELTSAGGGDMTITIDAVDGSATLGPETAPIKAGPRPIELDLPGAPGAVVRLLVRKDGDVVGFAEARADAPPTAGDGGDPQPVEQCSAIGADVEVEPQPQLPQKVADIREQLAELAARCDFDGLEEIATSNSGDVGFTFTYGDAEQGPAAYWRDREAEGEPVMRRLLEVLSLGPIRQDPAPDIPEGQGPPVQWVWPAVSGTDRPTDAHWNDLRRYYSDEEVDGAREQLGAWYGHRIGITLDGDWIYFVAGD